MTAVPGFDERLTRALDEEAAIAGESAHDYMQGAVIMRLVADATRRGIDDLAALLDYIAAMGMDGPLLPGAFATAVVRDPARLRALEATGLLDTPPEDRYDRIVAMAVEALDAPAAAFTLVDRDRAFLKSVRGLPEPMASDREAPIEYSVCRYTVAKSEPLIVGDARTDALLIDHPAVVDGTVVAYAGIPIIDDAAQAIGTLCVWDDKPRRWGTGHVRILTDLAAIIRSLALRERQDR